MPIENASEMIRCADYFFGRPRLAALLGSAERAIIVAHVGYRQAEAGGWFIAGVKGWRWLMPWRYERSIRRDLDWLVAEGWIEKKEQSGRRSMWRLGARAEEFESLNPGQNDRSTQVKMTAVPRSKCPGYPGQNDRTENTGEYKELTPLARGLISDFYRRWHGSLFQQPEPTKKEIDLAVEVVRAFGGDAERACRVQASVVDTLRHRFKDADRFIASGVTWRKKIAAIKSEVDRKEGAAKDSSVRKADAARRDADADKSQAVYERTVARWDKLPRDEQRRFREGLPEAVRGNKFYVVVAYADRMSEAKNGVH